MLDKNKGKLMFIVVLSKSIDILNELRFSMNVAIKEFSTFRTQSDKKSFKHKHVVVVRHRGNEFRYLQKAISVFEFRIT